MTTFDLAEQLSTTEQEIIKYIQANIQFDWATVTPIRLADNSYQLNDVQAQKVLYALTKS